MHCFSLVYDGWSEDESRYSKLAADSRPGRFVVHWVRPPSAGLVETMRKIVWHHDAPTPIHVWNWCVMQKDLPEHGVGGALCTNPNDSGASGEGAGLTE